MQSSMVLAHVQSTTPVRDFSEGVSDYMCTYEPGRVSSGTDEAPQHSRFVTWFQTAAP